MIKILLIGAIKFAYLFSLYLCVFMKEQSEAAPEEYKIVYSLDGSTDLFTKYFMANDPEAARGMFAFVLRGMECGMCFNSPAYKQTLYRS